jgi:hypothetical protein
MSAWLIAGVGVVYIVISGLEFMKGRTDIAMVFGGYAFSQIGLYMAAR